MIYANVTKGNFGRKTENGLTYLLGVSLYTIRTNGGENAEIRSVEEIENLIVERGVDLIQFGIGGFPIHATPVEKARKHFKRFVRAACDRDS